MGNSFFIVKTGSFSEKSGMLVPKTIALFAGHGFNCIIDFAFGGADQKLAEEFLKKYVDDLHNFKVYFVNLTVSPEVAEKREQERGGFKGLAAGQQYSLLKSLQSSDFDLEIDTSGLSPEQIAQKIVDFMKSRKDPKAFDLLYKHYFQ